MCSRRLPRQGATRVALSRCCAHAPSSATAHAARRSFAPPCVRVAVRPRRPPRPRATYRSFAPPCARAVFRDSACRASLFRAAVRLRRPPRQRVPRVAFSHCRAPASSSAIVRDAHRSFAPPCARAVFRDRARRASLFRAAVRMRRLPRQRMPRVALSRCCAPAQSSATACHVSLFRAAVCSRRLPRQRVPRVALSRRRVLAPSSATARAARRSFALLCAREVFCNSACRASLLRTAARRGNAGQAVSGFT